MKEEFYIYNGVLQKESEPIISINNRAFQYGDGFFETMFAYNNNVPFLNLHLSRIDKAMKVFQFISFDLFKEIEELRTLIVFLARKNKLYKAYRVRLSIFRNQGGYYSPSDNSISYTIQTTPLPYDKFYLNSEGLKIDIYKDLQKDFSILSPFKTSNSLIYILASKYAISNQFDDVLLLNSKGNIVESSHSNVFFVVDNKIYTPSINEGCIDGIMRHLIIYTLKEQNIAIEETEISMDILDNCDEIFLTNAITGLRFVSMYRTKRYINFTTKNILQELMKKTFINL